MFRVYLSPSSQEHNIGVLGYGTEEDNMHLVAQQVKQFLDTTGKFEVAIATKSDTPSSAATASNKFKADLHLCLHSDAGSEGAVGTTVFVRSFTSKAYSMACILYRELTRVNLTKDRGVKERTNLHELNATTAPAMLVELFFHTSPVEVKDFQGDRVKYARAVASSICQMFGVPFIEMPEAQVESLINRMKLMGIQFDEEYWTSVLSGTQNPKLAYLKTLIERMVLAYETR